MLWIVDIGTTACIQISSVSLLPSLFIPLSTFNPSAYTYYASTYAGPFAAGNGTFVSLAQVLPVAPGPDTNGSGYKVYEYPIYSTNGVNWLSASNKAGVYIFGYNTCSLTFFKGLFVFYNSKTHYGNTLPYYQPDFYLTSIDGNVWTTRSLPATAPTGYTTDDSHINTLITGTDTLLCINNYKQTASPFATTCKVSRSMDGISYTTVATLSVNTGTGEYDSLGFVNGRFFLLQYSTSNMLYSQDGTTWATVSAPFTFPNPTFYKFSFGYANGIYIISSSHTGGTGATYYSTDLSTWYPITKTQYNGCYFATVNNQFLLVSNTGVFNAKKTMTVTSDFITYNDTTPPIIDSNSGILNMNNTTVTNNTFYYMDGNLIQYIPLPAAAATSLQGLNVLAFSGVNGGRSSTNPLAHTLTAIPYPGFTPITTTRLLYTQADDGTPASIANNSTFFTPAINTGGTYYPALSVLQNFFTTKFEGYFYAPVSGTYTFYGGADDSIYVWIDTLPINRTLSNVILSYNRYSPITYTGPVTVTLSAGCHPFCVISDNQSSGGGGYSLDLQFWGPNITANNRDGTGYYYTQPFSVIPGQFVTSGIPGSTWTNWVSSNPVNNTAYASISGVYSLQTNSIIPYTTPLYVQISSNNSFDSITNMSGTVIAGNTGDGVYWTNGVTPYGAYTNGNSSIYPIQTTQQAQICPNSKYDSINKIIFSKPVTNVHIAIASMGGSPVNTQYLFDQPFTIVSTITGTKDAYWNSDTAVPLSPYVTTYNGTTYYGVSGVESDGIIKFSNTLQNINWVVLTPEWYSAIQIAATPVYI
jgi:hypothetical protein